MTVGLPFMTDLLWRLEYWVSVKEREEHFEESLGECWCLADFVNYVVDIYINHLYILISLIKILHF